MDIEEIINSSKENYKSFFEDPLSSLDDKVIRNKENCFGFDSINQANLWALFVLNGTMRYEHEKRFKKEIISVEKLKSALAYKMSFTNPREIKEYIASPLFQKLKEFIAQELFWRS
jgi:hypothetical protein